MVELQPREKAGQDPGNDAAILDHSAKSFSQIISQVPNKAVR